MARPWRNWPFRGVTLHAVHCLASPLGANNDDVILKAIVLVYIRHHWIEKHPSRRTELPAWGLPAMSRRVWAVWRTVASPRHVRIVLYNPCSCCYSMLRSVDTWTGDLFRKPPRRRGPLAVLPENDRPSMVSAFLEVLHHALPLGLCAVNGRGHPEQGLVSLPIILIIHNWHPV